MSITDELRTSGVHMPFSDTRVFLNEELTAIADRIDAEHEKALDEQFKQLTTGMEPMTDENMAKHGWVRGPLDADGEMWRRGDMSDSNWGVIEGIAYEDGRWFISGHDISAPWIPADSIRHYHAPTVEYVLRELVGKAQALSNVDDEDELVAEFAKRLTLAGDAE